MLGSTVGTIDVKTFVSSHSTDSALFALTAAGSDKVEVKDQQTQTAWSMTKEQGLQATRLSHYLQFMLISTILSFSFSGLDLSTTAETIILCCSLTSLHWL